MTEYEYKLRDFIADAMTILAPDNCEECAKWDMCPHSYEAELTRLDECWYSDRMRELGIDE